MSNPYINLADEKLMILYQQGEEQAFEVIYSRYSGKVYSFLSKRISEKGSIDDVFQAVFMKFHKTRQLYNDDYLLAKWVYVICRSELNDFYRRSLRNTKLKSELSIDSKVIDTEPIDVEDYLLNKNLSTKETDALKLRYQEDLEFEDIGKKLGITESNSRKIISRALGKLKSIYGRSYEK